MRLFSPAKVNLFLRVLARREDGYHELASLFQAVTLGDTLTLSIEGDEDELTTSDPTLVCDASNLVLKAAHLFRKKTGLQFSLRCHLEKMIPVQSGLGGGSSNAATTLFALNRLLNTNIPLESLAAWGGEIGADIPFFFSSGTAYCTGKGENVLNVPPVKLDKPLWVVKPQEGLSTPAIFKAFQLERASSASPQLLLENFQKGEHVFINDLESPSFSLLPSLLTLKEKLMAQGFSVFMTGSGTALVACGEKRPQAPGCYISPLSFSFRKEGSWYDFP